MDKEFFFWGHSILERLELMLKQCGASPKISSLPSNLVCSTKFLLGWIESGKDFGSYSINSPYVFFLCTNGEDVKKAKRELFKDSKKETDGWVSKNINAKISIPISRFFSRYPLHPNWITLMNLPFAFLGPYLFLGNNYKSALLSGLVFQWASILDGCDGEIARTKLQVTKMGGWLDTAVDNFSYLLFFFAVGLWKSNREAQPFYLQALIGGLVCLTIALLLTYWGMAQLGTQTHHVYRRAFEELSTSSPILRVVNRLNFLSKRENFALGIFLLCIFNLKDMIYWIVLGAVWLYAVVVIGTFPGIWKRAKSQPHA